MPKVGDIAAKFVISLVNLNYLKNFKYLWKKFNTTTGCFSISL